jgi:hypothetical protein
MLKISGCFLFVMFFPESESLKTREAQLEDEDEGENPHYYYSK